MQFQKAHKLSIVPAVLLGLFSFICIVLTSVYWILTDWVISRYVQIPSTHPEKDRWPTNDVIVEWTEASTNATITSGCLNLFAACVAIVAWKRLRNHELDTDFNAPLRRFYFIAVYITGACGSVCALAALILHFTDKGDDQWGCVTTTGHTFQSPAKGVPFDNLLCSRELGACKFLATHAKKETQGSTNSACNAAVAVKWMQLILILAGCATMTLFFFQARLRRHVRWSLQSNPS